MKKEEFGPYKIYKNANPSSIIDYVGGHLPRRKNSLPRPLNPLIMNYSRNRTFSEKTTIESKSTSRKINLLKPSKEERIVIVEESSSSNSIDSNNDKNIVRHKNIIKQYKSVNTQFQLSNTNINNSRIYGSANNIYNYKVNNKNIRNQKYLMNISYTSDRNNPLDKFSPFQEDIYSNIDMSRSLKSSIDDEKSEFNLNIYPETDGEKQLYIKKRPKIHKHKDFQGKSKVIKNNFYFLIAFLYLSLYLLCLKITINLSMPKIIALGVSSFIINFNNLLISLLFMKLDQINFHEFIKYKFGNYFLKIVFNYIRILLTIRSLQYLNILSFILIINMSPLVVSYIYKRENNQSFKASDSIYYFIFIIICLIEFIINDKISMICAFILMIINTFISLAKINIIRNIHSYLIDFGSSVIGIAISPLIMTINEDLLCISFSQYLLFIIICFTYFLNHYFERKLTLKSLVQRFQILLNTFLFFLYIIYSNFLLRENNYLITYLFLLLSFIINIHAKIRIQSNDI